MSAVTWLDYSEHERRKMLDVIDLFRERETRDELGLGAVRDAFGDRFFPGTSTVMTRARYFLLVPWIYERLEAKRISSAEIDARARSWELDLIGAINKSDDHEGNIGKLAGRRLKRLPSSVYWAGLLVWGIRLFPGSQSQYHRALDGRYKALHSHRTRESGRDGEHDDRVRPNWRAGLVPPPEGFPWKCSLRLRRCEAEYLCERIRTEPTTSHSLLAEFIARRWRCEGVRFVWEHPPISELPATIRRELWHAQNFSELTHGAALLYNLILAEQTRREEGVSEFEAALNEWTATMDRRAIAFNDWDRAEFWSRVEGWNPRVSPFAKEFINNWWDLVLELGPARIAASSTARNVIRDRERWLKKSLARIDNPRAGELWRGASGNAQIDFRWPVVQRILRDLFDGLEAKDA